MKRLYAALLLGIMALLIAGHSFPARAQSAGYSPNADGVTFPSKAWASLGDASSSPGKAYYSPDAPGGPSLVVSTGLIWQAFARGVSFYTYVLAANDNGVHTFTYAQSGTPNVYVSVEDNTTTGLLLYSLYNVTSTGATVRVTRGRQSALPEGYWPR